MKKIDVVIVTEDRYVNPKEITDYNRNVLLEDKLVLDALETQKLNVTRKSWSDPDFDWSSTKYILFRSTWDYAERYSEFSRWLETTRKKTTLLNSANTIHWNIDKHYLLDLQKKGVHVCESHFIKKGSLTSLTKLHSELGWNKTVLKPCISGGGRHTYKLELDTLSKHEGIFQELIANEDMMLQPFQENIITKGEYSFMVMNGQYTHAVLKIAKPGDFRVQDDFGGSVHAHEATSEEIIFVEKAVKACPEIPMYARVDVILDNNDQLAISELELIEPELWFRNYPEAANVLARGVKQICV